MGRKKKIELSDIFSLSEVTNLLGISHSSIYEWVKKGTFPKIQFSLGKRSPLLFLKSDIEKILGEHYYKCNIRMKRRVHLDDLLDLPKVCKILRMSASTIYNWVKIGKLSYIKLNPGKRSPLFFLKSDLELLVTNSYLKNNAGNKKS